MKGTGASVDMGEEFRHLALQVIGEALLSLTPEESDSVFPKLYLPIMEEANRWSLEPWREHVRPIFRRQRERLRQLDRYIFGLISKRWAARLAGNDPHKNDIVGRIMHAADPDTWHDGLEVQLCYEIKTFVLAGHETSAAMMSWCLYELQKAGNAHAPRVLAEAAKAGLGVANAPSRDAVEGAMDYTYACLKETLRLYSVVPVVTRTAVEDDVLGGVPVPAGTRIILSIQARARRRRSERRRTMRAREYACELRRARARRGCTTGRTCGRSRWRSSRSGS